MLIELRIQSATRQLERSDGAPSLAAAIAIENGLQELEKAHNPNPVPDEEVEKFLKGLGTIMKDVFLVAKHF